MTIVEPKPGFSRAGELRPEANSAEERNKVRCGIRILYWFSTTPFYDRFRESDEIQRKTNQSNVYARTGLIEVIAPNGTRRQYISILQLRMDYAGMAAEVVVFANGKEKTFQSFMRYNNRGAAQVAPCKFQTVAGIRQRKEKTALPCRRAHT
ncbi:hypothetical protein F6P96_01660 [Escherichia coli]|nr:hypothetical protein F6P96_01660 [Escherichia coli]